VRVEFIKEFTEAIVTRGWFRPRTAHLIVKTEEVWGEFSNYTTQKWVFASTERPVGWWTELHIDRAAGRILARRERDRIRGREWVAVELPAAQLVRRVGEES
jgi:hypothetical protein